MGIFVIELNCKNEPSRQTWMEEWTTKYLVDSLLPVLQIPMGSKIQCKNGKEPKKDENNIQKKNIMKKKKQEFIAKSDILRFFS